MRFDKLMVLNRTCVIWFNMAERKRLRWESPDTCLNQNDTLTDEKPSFRLQIIICHPIWWSTAISRTKIPSIWLAWVGIEAILKQTMLRFQSVVFGIWELINTLFLPLESSWLHYSLVWCENLLSGSVDEHELFQSSTNGKENGVLKLKYSLNYSLGWNRGFLQREWVVEHVCAVERETGERQKLHTVAPRITNRAADGLNDQ